MIREEVMNPVEISEVISLIEMVLNLTSSTDGCSPDTKIKSYLHEVLRYPKKKNLNSKTVSIWKFGILKISFYQCILVYTYSYS